MPPEDRPFEFMLNALRLLNGVPASLYAERSGLPLESILPSSNACAVTVCFRRIPTALRRRAGAWISCRMFRKLFYKEPALSSSWPCTTLAQLLSFRAAVIPLQPHQPGLFELDVHNVVHGTAPEGTDENNFGAYCARHALVGAQ